MNRFSVRRSVVLIFILSISLCGFAKKPDFSGNWKFNSSESKQNPEFSFAPGKIVITQEKNSVTMESVSEFQGEQYTMKSTCTLDGKESINEGWQGAKNVSIASWEADKKTLGIVTTIEMMDGGELKIHATYKLDGQKLVIVNTVEGGPMQVSPETWVYDKQ
jgi:hypothetical protein